MAQYFFGTGQMFGKSLTNTPATPVRFGALQDVSIDISFSTKELYSDKQFPVDVGRGVGKITGKASFAQLSAQTFNDLFFGLSNPSTGSIRTAVEEAHTVGEITANTVFPTNNSTYRADYGVILASDGSLYTRVTSNATGQQYVCNETSGTYTFNGTQNGVALKISYEYTDASNGKKITLSNQLLGSAPQFSLVLTGGRQAAGTSTTKRLNLELNACMSSKLTLPTKLEDFMINDFEFQGFCDSGGNWGTLSIDE
jgi:hypothetical protein